MLQKLEDIKIVSLVLIAKVVDVKNAMVMEVFAIIFLLWKTFGQLVQFVKERNTKMKY